MMNECEKIDFVILWVDGNDPAWQEQFNRYAPRDRQIAIDASAERYRDWDCLRYWFRGVEQFAPWVNKVHFVTCGQVPEWLNTDCEKLHIVSHADFMAKEYLPTFSANPIEDNLHRIEGLAEHFVYFNDDFYLTHAVSPARFFRHGLPTDMAVCNTIQSPALMGHITLNNLDIINRHFSKRRVLRRVGQWFRWSYGLQYMLRTVALLPWPRFSGFFDHHLPQGYRKQTLQEVWETEPHILHATSTHRFRHIEDVNQWLFRYWHLCKGEFAPLNVVRDSAFYKLTDENFAEAVEIVAKQKKNIIVLNDSESLSDFEGKKAKLKEAFETILPHKSMFEK